MLTLLLVLTVCTFSPAPFPSPLLWFTDYSNGSAVPQSTGTTRECLPPPPCAASSVRALPWPLWLQLPPPLPGPEGVSECHTEIGTAGSAAVVQPWLAAYTHAHTHTHTHTHRCTYVCLPGVFLYFSAPSAYLHNFQVRICLTTSLLSPPPKGAASKAHSLDDAKLADAACHLQPFLWLTEAVSLCSQSNSLHR